MGRKIPGRKHRGVRDLEKQQQERLEKLKDKINATPKEKDLQEIPKSLAGLMMLKKKMCNSKFTHKKPKKNGAVVFKPTKPGFENGNGPVYVQGSEETDRQFIVRVNKVVSEVLKENAFEKKYGIQIKRNIETGEVDKIVKRDKDPLEMFAEELRKNKIEANKKNKTSHSDNLSKAQKKLQKQKVKNEWKNSELLKDAMEVHYEKVAFGEVAHVPPTLVVPKKAENTICAPRPGAKNLLLKNLLNEKSNDKSLKKNITDLEKGSPSGKLNMVQLKPINRSGKRKNLPIGLRRQLDQQQSDIVKAYKEWKKEKYMNN